MHTVDLIDVASGIHAEGTVIDADTLRAAGRSGPLVSLDAWKIRMKRLRGGMSDGVDVIDVDNGHLSLSVLPTRGMGIWRGRCGSLPLQWESPVPLPVHPSFIDPSRRGGLGWLDGFNELICRCGLAWHGAPGTDIRRDDDGNIVSEQFLPLHGRIAGLAAHQVTARLSDDGSIALTGVVDECSVFDNRLRLTAEFVTWPGASRFTIRDRITNLGSRPAEIELLYHCNFGSPLLDAGSRFHAAIRQVAPRDARAAEGTDRWDTFEGPVSGYAEQVYFMEPVADSDGKGLACLTDPDQAAAVAVRFDTQTLPWMTLWKNTQAVADGYCCGVEPSTSLPNNRQFEREQGRVIELPPGASRDFEVSFEIAETRDAVQNLLTQVQELQGTSSCQVRDTPLPGWS